MYIIICNHNIVQYDIFIPISMEDLNNTIVHFNISYNICTSGTAIPVRITVYNTTSVHIYLYGQLCSTFFKYLYVDTTKCNIMCVVPTFNWKKTEWMLKYIWKTRSQTFKRLKLQSCKAYGEPWRIKSTFIITQKYNFCTN